MTAARGSMRYPWGSVRFPWGLPCPDLLCPNVAPWVSPWVSDKPGYRADIAAKNLVTAKKIATKKTWSLTLYDDQVFLKCMQNTWSKWISICQIFTLKKYLTVQEMVLLSQKITTKLKITCSLSWPFFQKSKLGHGSDQVFFGHKIFRSH